MDLKRIEVKFYLPDEDAISSDDAFRVFNSWIPQTADEVLVDVADYSHVPDGPRTLLVAHEHNYALDYTDRRLGLYCANKMASGDDLVVRIRATVETALKACQRLERESEFEGKVRFDGGELLLTANDRLNAPNTDATASAVEPHIRAVADGLYSGAKVTIERDTNPKQRFNLRVKVDGDFDVDTLLANLGSA